VVIQVEPFQGYLPLQGAKKKAHRNLSQAKYKLMQAGIDKIILNYTSHGSN